MKSFMFLFFSLLALEGLKAQENIQTETNLNTQALTYHKEVPDISTYKISKNETGLDLTLEVLEQINFYRRKDEHFLWVVDDKIEILIYPIGKMVPIEATNTIEKK